MAGEQNAGSGKYGKRRKTGTDGLYLGRGQYLSTDANAMMIFHGTENWGQIQLTFNEPVLGPATTEWYNSPSEDDKFDRFRRQEGYIMPGKEIGIYDGVLIGAGGAALAVSAGSFTDLLVCPVVCSSFLGDRLVCSRCFIRKVKGY